MAKGLEAVLGAGNGAKIKGVEPSGQQLMELTAQFPTALR